MPDHPPITALHITPPEPGEMRKLADDLFWMRFVLPFRLNHVNLFALDTDAGWLLMDCGINNNDTAAHWEFMLQGPLAGKPVVGIIVTHYHADHVGYAGQLSEKTGAPIYMGAVEYEQALWGLAQSDAEYAKLLCDAYSRFGLAKKHMDRAYANGNYYRCLTGSLPNVNIIDETHSFKTIAGNWTVRFDAGHSPAHMSLTDATRKIHICADFLLPRITPNISTKIRDLDCDMLADYIHYLQSMTKCSADCLIIPGHDWPYYGGGERANQLLMHHKARLEQLVNSVRNKPINTQDAMLTLFPFEMTEHEIFFASCEARAHLNHLVAQGQFVQTQSSSGVDIFTKS